MRGVLESTPSSGRSMPIISVGTSSSPRKPSSIVRKIALTSRCYAPSHPVPSECLAKHLGAVPKFPVHEEGLEPHALRRRNLNPVGVYRAAARCSERRVPPGCSLHLASFRYSPWTIQRRFPRPLATATSRARVPEPGGLSTFERVGSISGLPMAHLDATPYQSLTRPPPHSRRA